MAFFPHQLENSDSKSKSKLLLLPKLIREACAQCSHGSCLRCSTPSSLSSLKDTCSTLGDADLDHKQLIILEIQSRMRKAKSSKPKELLPFSGGMLTWAVSPTTGRVRITPLMKEAATVTATAQGEEERDDGEDGGDQTEEFLSVKSYFSCYSIDGSSSSVESKNTGGGTLGVRRSILEEFRHCEGWPFGLCRRAVVLPPLPSSPSDSWMWRKRNLVCKTNFPKVATTKLDH